MELIILGSAAATPIKERNLSRVALRDKNQILLYQYKTTASVMREAIVRIINSNGRLIVDDINIGMYSEIRDIIAWDRNTAEVDELCILDINDMGDDIGFTSKMIYCTFNHKGLLEKESPSCPACGKLFKSLENLNDHINNLKKQDGLHQDFDKNKLNFELGYREKSQANSDKYKLYYKPKFGKINIKKKK